MNIIWYVCGNLRQGPTFWDLITIAQFTGAAWVKWSNLSPQFGPCLPGIARSSSSSFADSQSTRNIGDCTPAISKLLLHSCIKAIHIRWMKNCVWNASLFYILVYVFYEWIKKRLEYSWCVQYLIFLYSQRYYLNIFIRHMYLVSQGKKKYWDRGLTICSYFSFYSNQYQHWEETSS